MPIKPGNTPITYSSSNGSGILYVNTCGLTEVFQNFDRLEYSYKRLRDAPTDSGALPLIVTAFGNQPIQLLTTCTGDVPRPLTPDNVNNNIDNIKKRWNILRYTITGGCNTFTDVENLRAQLEEDLTTLNGFDLYLAELNMDVSVTYLEALQALTFSNIITTNLSLTSNLFDGTISNLLLTEFTWDAEYESTNAASVGGYTTLYGFSATLQNFTYATQGPIPS
jgi:hypothetical protein